MIEGPAPGDVFVASAEQPRRSFLSATLSTYATNVAVAVLSLGNVLVVSRALGPSGRGAVALMTTIAVVTHYFSTFGVQEANANIGGAEPERRPTLATNSLILAVLFGGAAVLLLGGLISVLPDVAGEAGPRVLAVTLLAVPILIVQTYLSRLVQAEYRFGLSNLSWLTGPATSLVLNGLFWLLGTISVATAVAAWAFGQGLGALLLVAYIARRGAFGKPDVALARRSVGFGIKAHVGTAMQFGNYRLDQWLLGTIVGTRELGLYSVAVAWAEALFFLPAALGIVQRPDLVRSRRREAGEQVAQVFRATVLATVPLALGMLLVAPVLCVAILGERFRGSIGELRLLVPGAFGILALKLLGNALTAQRKPLLQTYAIAVSFVSTIVLDLLLIPRYAGIGAAIASSVAYTMGGIAIVLIFLRTLERRPRDLLPSLQDGRLLVAGAARLPIALRSLRRGRSGLLAAEQADHETGGPGGVHRP